MEGAKVVSGELGVTQYAGAVLEPDVVKLHMQYGALSPRNKEEMKAMHDLYQNAMQGRELGEDELSWTTRKKIIAIGLSSTVMALYMRMRRMNCVPTFTGVGALMAATVSEMHWPGLLRDPNAMAQIVARASEAEKPIWKHLEQLAKDAMAVPDEEEATAFERMLNAHREATGKGGIKIRIVRPGKADADRASEIAREYAKLTPAQKQALVAVTVTGGNGVEWTMECAGAYGSGSTKQMASMVARLAAAGKLV